MTIDIRMMMFVGVLINDEKKLLSCKEYKKNDNEESFYEFPIVRTTHAVFITSTVNSGMVSNISHALSDALGIEYKKIKQNIKQLKQNIKPLLKSYGLWNKDNIKIWAIQAINSDVQSTLEYTDNKKYYLVEEDFNGKRKYIDAFPDIFKKDLQQLNLVDGIEIEERQMQILKSAFPNIVFPNNFEKCKYFIKIESAESKDLQQSKTYLIRYYNMPFGDNKKVYHDLGELPSMSDSDLAELLNLNERKYLDNSRIKKNDILVLQRLIPNLKHKFDFDNNYYFIESKGEVKEKVILRWYDIRTKESIGTTKLTVTLDEFKKVFIDLFDIEDMCVCFNDIQDNYSYYMNWLLSKLKTPMPFDFEKYKYWIEYAGVQS